MSRRMKLKTRERGFLEVLAVQESGGTWEQDWEPLRGTPVGALFSRVSQHDLNHALNGWTHPLVEALGLSPEMALAKLPSGLCDKQYGCTLHDPRKCLVLSKKLPWCYEPAGLEMLTSIARIKAAEAVFLWKQQVYVVIAIQET
jgi:hypothetical protein